MISPEVLEAAKQLREIELHEVKELIAQRRAGLPTSSMTLCVGRLIDLLEMEEQKRDRCASLLWEVVARYVPAQDLAEINKKARFLFPER